MILGSKTLGASALLCPVKHAEMTNGQHEGILESSGMKDRYAVVGHFYDLISNLYSVKSIQKKHFRFLALDSYWSVLGQKSA